MWNKIVSVDHTGLEPWAQTEIRKYSRDCIFYTEDPGSAAEVIERIKDADVVFVSWRTPLPKEVLMHCPNLKYVGMCCSLYDEKSANVDIAYAKERGIVVKGIRNYGDEGLVEFIFYSLIGLFHGFGPFQWGEKQEELTGKTIGIIGLGATGQMVMERALSFGMKVVYFNRSRKEELEGPRVTYLPLHDLLKSADIVTTHLPKHSVILGAEEFQKLGTGKILINTSLEPTFEVPAFQEWIRQKESFAIMDRSAMGRYFEELKVCPNLIFTEKVTGFTRQAEQRLSKKVLENFLSVTE